jgi:hypothetical protein
MEIQITLTAGRRNLQEVKAALESQPAVGASGTRLEIRERKTKYRAIDPNLLVAIVGAAGAGLGALITGLFQIGQQIAAKKFVLETHDGNKLEVPANTSPEKIDELLSKLRESDVKKITVA